MQTKRLVKAEIKDGKHKYCGEIGHHFLDIYFGDQLFDDNTFTGWVPILLLSDSLTEKVSLIQIENSGRLVEWELIETGSRLNYKSHRFIDNLAYDLYAGDADHVDAESSLSLGHSSLKTISRLVGEQKIVNHEEFISIIISLCTKVIINPLENTLRCCEKGQVSPALSSRIHHILGPSIIGMVYNNTAGYGAPPATHLEPPSIFKTCLARWRAKLKFLEYLLYCSSTGEDLELPCGRKLKFIFSYANDDYSWICNVVRISDLSLGHSYTVYLFETGEVGLISTIFIPFLNCILISPHDKNGIININMAVQLIGRVALSFCSDVYSGVSAQPDVCNAMQIFGLTNAGSLYHLVANDLFGLVEYFDFFKKHLKEIRFTLGSGLDLLPVILKHELLDNAVRCHFDMASDLDAWMINDGGILPRCFNRIDVKPLSLAKSPYVLSSSAKSLYGRIVELAYSEVQSLKLNNFNNCLIAGHPPDSLLNKYSLIVIGIRCGRRRPLNQAELIRVVLETAANVNSNSAIIIEGTYRHLGTDGESLFIEEELRFIDSIKELPVFHGLSIPVFSFVGKSPMHSSFSAFSKSIVIAPWGAGLTRHMFFSEKRYIIHTNNTNLKNMISNYYSWELPFRPISIDYLGNIGDDVDSSRDDAASRLDSSRPAWRLFDNYNVDLPSLRSMLVNCIGQENSCRQD